MTIEQASYISKVDAGYPSKQSHMRIQIPAMSELSCPQIFIPSSSCTNLSPTKPGPSHHKPTTSHPPAVPHTAADHHHTHPAQEAVADLDSHTNHQNAPDYAIHENGYVEVEVGSLIVVAVLLRILDG